MSVIDLSKLLSKYKKGWLALTPDNRNLIATGKTLDEVLKKAKKRGVGNPSVLKAASIDHLMVG